MWGSVWGQRLWYWLRGEDFEMSETEHLKSISHSHVLAPEMRTPEKAWAVAHKLLHKAAMRLRSHQLRAGSIGLVPDRLHSLNLFDSLENAKSRTKLLEAMDQLNQKYGMSTLAPATMLAAYKAAPLWFA